MRGQGTVVDGRSAGEVVVSGGVSWLTTLLTCRALGGLALSSAALLGIACAQSEAAGHAAPSDTSRGAASHGGALIFEEVAAAVGLDFVHQNGAEGEYHMAEVSGSGVAFFDYDNDGDLDVYFVQSGALPDRASDGSRASRDRLFRNELNRSGSRNESEGGSGLAFVDVTAESGTWGPAMAWASLWATTTTTAGKTST